MSGDHGAALIAARQLAAGHTARRRRHEVGGRPRSGHLPALCRQVGRRTRPPPARGRPLCRPLGRASTRCCSSTTRACWRARRLARVLSLRGHMDRAYAEARSSFEMAQSSGAGITVCWVVHDALCPIALMGGDLAAAEGCHRGDERLGDTDECNPVEDDGDLLEGKAAHRTWRIRPGYRADIADIGSLRAVGLADVLRPVPRLSCRRPGRAWSSRGGRRQTGACDRVGGTHNGEGWYQAELMRMKGELMLQQSKAPARHRGGGLLPDGK